MKYLTGISLGVLLGIVVGAWGPREDLKTLKAQVQERGNVRKASEASGFDAFAKMVNIPDVAKRPAKSVRAKSAPSTNVVAQAAKPSMPSQPSQLTQPSQRPKPFSREDLRARIDEAADLWRTRVELAKTQWKDKLGISGDEKSEAFESALTAMNESLLETMTALAEEIEKSEKMTPELGLRLMGDASRTMAETYDALGALVPADRRGEVSELPVFEFIDPSVAEPLIGVQDKLDVRDWRGHRR